MKAGVIQTGAEAPELITARNTAFGEADLDHPVAHFGDETADPIVADVRRSTEEIVRSVSRTETGQGLVSASSER